MPSREKPGRAVLDGAFTLLDVLNQAHEAGLTRIAGLSGLPKTTAYRLLQQLTELGAVTKHSGHYRIGPRVFALCGTLWRPDPLLERASLTPMRRLAGASGANLHLCIRAFGQAMVVAANHPVPAMPVYLHPGTVGPRSTAASKVLLAWNEPRAAQPTICQAQADEIRHRGAVFDYENVLPGIFCVAVPVFGADATKPVASLAAMIRLPQRLAQLEAALKRTSEMIGRSLAG